MGGCHVPAGIAACESRAGSGRGQRDGAGRGGGSPAPSRDRERLGGTGAAGGTDQNRPLRGRRWGIGAGWGHRGRDRVSRAALLAGNGPGPDPSSAPTSSPAPSADGAGAAVCAAAAGAEPGRPPGPRGDLPAGAGQAALLPALLGLPLRRAGQAPALLVRGAVPLPGLVPGCALSRRDRGLAGH